MIKKACFGQAFLHVNFKTSKNFFINPPIKYQTATLQFFYQLLITLITGDSKQSRLRGLKNGVPQGSVLAPLLFNIYTYDLPSMISRKFAYADDLALLHSSGNWKDLGETLSQDMSTLSLYLQIWRLKLSHTKTVTTAFHLNNREAKRELKVYNNGRLLLFCPTPTYLEVKLDRSLTFRHHLVALRKNYPRASPTTAEATRGLGMGCWC